MYPRFSSAAEEGKEETLPTLLLPPPPLLPFYPGHSSPFPQFSSCIFIAEAIHSSAGRLTSALHRPAECHVKATPQSIYTPTCGTENVYHMNELGEHKPMAARA